MKNVQTKTHRLRKEPRKVQRGRRYQRDTPKLLPKVPRGLSDIRGQNSESEKIVEKPTYIIIFPLT